MTDASDPAEFRRGAVVGVGTYVLWGLLTAYWKLLHQFRPFELIGWRIATSAVLMGAIITVRREWAELLTVMSDRRLLLRVGIAALVLAANWTAYVTAVVHGRVLETALGYFIAPLATIAVGVVFLNEPLRRLQRVAVALAGGAVVILTIAYGRVPWLALVIAASWTVYSYLKRQVPLAPVQSMAAETLLLAVPAVVLAVAMAGAADSVPNSASGARLALVTLTSVATVVPLLLFAYTAQRLPLTVLGPLNLLVPIINFGLGWLAYGEPLDAAKLVGFALVWVGLTLVMVDLTRQRGPTPAHSSGHSPGPVPLTTKDHR